MLTLSWFTGGKSVFWYNSELWYEGNCKSGSWKIPVYITFDMDGLRPVITDTYVPRRPGTIRYKKMTENIPPGPGGIFLFSYAFAFSISVNLARVSGISIFCGHTAEQLWQATQEAGRLSSLRPATPSLTTKASTPL